MTKNRPFLIVVSGAPGSGKTTLARLLANELRVPHFERDRFFDSMELTIGEQFNRGKDGVPVFYELVSDALRHGVNLVIDGTLYAGKSEVDVKAFFALADVVNVHCRTADANERFKQREQSVSEDRAQWVTEFMPHLESIQSQVIDPLDLEWPVIKVDTTGSYDPKLQEIVDLLGRELPLLN
jgi:cytidylate kinase